MCRSRQDLFSVKLSYQLAFVKVTLTWKEQALKNPDVLSQGISNLSALHVFIFLRYYADNAGYIGLLHVTASSLLSSVPPSEARRGPKNDVTSMSSWINHKELADSHSISPNRLYQSDQNLSPWECRSSKAALRGYLLSCRIRSKQTYKPLRLGFSNWIAKGKIKAF